MYVYQLNSKDQELIKAALIKAGIKGSDLENAMDSKVVDLKDTINVKKFLK
ncbi:hypothetical protein D3C87_914880 [compost metagenome]